MPARDQVHNFSAGPSALPPTVLEQAAAEMLDWRGTGVSVLEMSHRSKEFEAVLAETETALRAWLEVPADWTVLFLQGGATHQFSMVPMNLGPGAYAVAGSWGKKALKAAPGSQMVWDGSADGFRRQPRGAEIKGAEGWLHVTMNETIEGLEIPDDEWPDVPVVCDASSILGSRSFDWSRYGLVYAGAQKNLGPAGVTVVLIRPDVLEMCREDLAESFSFKAQAAAGSLLNTPPCGAIWMLGLCAQHWLRMGGLAATEAETLAKSRLIYEQIDARPDLFQGHAHPGSRSRTNVVFTLPDDELTAEFLAMAKAENMRDLKGHRSVGGLRASLYCAVPMQSARALAELMARFKG